MAPALTAAFRALLVAAPAGCPGGRADADPVQRIIDECGKVAALPAPAWCDGAAADD